MELRFASDSPSGFVAFSLCAKQAMTGWLAGAESEVILHITMTWMGKRPHFMAM